MTPLVLLSGWGCDARIWQPLAPYWPAGLRVTTPDWPGYGARPPLDAPACLDALATAMDTDLPVEALWVGWSLGGLLAAALLDHLPAPRGVVLLGIGSRFCHAGGVSHAALATFRRAFARDPHTALAHFRRWQLNGESQPQRAHHQLQRLLGEAIADTATLTAGLEWLAQLDVGQSLNQASCPVWRLSGGRDPLLAAELRAPALLDNSDRRLFDAGHCPMLSQPAALAEHLAELAAMAAEESFDAN